MPQFTLYRNVNRATQTRYPLLLDVQNELLDSLKTRLVIPAMKLAEQTPITHLNPTFTWEGQTYLLIAQEMAAIPLNSLGERVTNLADLRGEILAAIDLLITGI